MSFKLEIHLALFFLLALVLTILPLPYGLACFRPPWVLLLILYVQFFLPNYTSLTATVVLGLCLDVLLSTLLGEHIFALVLTTWLASTRARRFHMFLLPQQMVLITLLCFVYQLVLYAIDLYQDFNNTLLMVLGTTLLSLMIWPWLSMLLERSFHLGSQNRRHLSPQR